MTQISDQMLAAWQDSSHLLRMCSLTHLESAGALANAVPPYAIVSATACADVDKVDRGWSILIREEP